MSGPSGSDASSIDGLVQLLDLEAIEVDLFRGAAGPDRGLVRVFGGHVAAQALVAAHRSVEGKMVHSLHAYFLRAGDPTRPIIYEVDRIRDGRSYATRRVVGIQNGKAIFNLQASFQVPEEGYEHQQPGPEGIGDPEGLPDFYRWLAEQRELPMGRLVAPFDLRVVPEGSRFSRTIVFKADGKLPDDAVLHRCVAAFASDLTLLGVSLQPHGFPHAETGFMASLDHAMWFYRPFRADEWLVYQQETPSATGGRALTAGRMYTLQGALVLSVVQEGAVRPPRPVREH